MLYILIVTAGVTRVRANEERKGVEEEVRE